MPKRKDSFPCKWSTGSGRIIYERIVLYEASSSEDEDKILLNRAHIDEVKGREGATEERIPDNARKAMFRGFLAALHVCLEELTVLKKLCKRTVDPLWEEPLQYKTSEQLYSALEDTYDMYRFDDMRKSLKDICILFKILFDTFQEIQKEEKFTILEKYTQILQQQIYDESVLLDELNYAVKFKQHLKDAIIREKDGNKSDFLDMCEDVNKSKLLYEDILGFGRSQYYYNKGWETARVEQKKWSVAKETQSLEDTINKCQQDITNEIRVHTEIEQYCTEYVRDLNQQIDQWQNNYETELEKDDSHLIYLRNEVEELISKHDELQKIYDKRTKEMEAWIKYRTKKKAEDDLRKKQGTAAVKIQSWWRGVMFRKHLGPYRKKKGKKGNQKGDKKKAKGKK